MVKLIKGGIYLDSYDNSEDFFGVYVGYFKGIFSDNKHHYFYWSDNIQDAIKWYKREITKGLSSKPYGTYSVVNINKLKLVYKILKEKIRWEGDYYD